MNHEPRLSQVFVELADTLVAGFDAIDFLHTLSDHSVQLLDADAAGVILTDQRGRMHVVASTSNLAHLLDLFEVQSAAGPSLDCVTTGRAVVNVGRSEAERRWPHFNERSVQAGYLSTHALPLRLRDQVIGALNLLCSDHVTLTDDDVVLGQALADIATIGILQERAVRESELVAAQLQTALNSRIIIEQAKGIVSAQARVDVDEAFILLRAHSRRTGTPLTDVAAAVIDGSMSARQLQRA